MVCPGWVEVGSGGVDLIRLPATGIQLDFLAKDHALLCCHSPVLGFLEAVMAKRLEE